MKKIEDLNQLPKIVVILTIVLSIFPLILHFAGLDFSTASVAVTSHGDDLDRAFYTLKGAFSHTILEWSAFSLALITCFLAFTDFAIKRDPATPVIGVALLCAGIMDAFHTLAAIRFVNSLADNSDFIPFTWALCRMFNAFICLIGVSLFLLGKRLPRKSAISIISIASILFGSISYLIIDLAASSEQLPNTQFPGALISRPFDLGPILIYVFSGFVFYQFFKRRPGPFSHALLLSTLPNIATQAYMAFGSEVLFDSFFNIGHFTKILSYGLPFVGLCWGYVSTNKEKENLNSKMRAITSSLDRSSMVSEANASGKITYVNSNFLKTTKFKQYELLGDSYKRFSSELDNALQKAINVTRGIVKGEFKFLDRDGEALWFEATISPILDSEGNIEKFVVIKYDITDKKLAESKTIEAMRKSQELARSKGLFLANMSHEIRTPMNGILGMITLLKDTKLSKEQREMLETIRSCGDGLMTILNDILDFSKVESGNIQLEIMDFNLKKCVEEVLYLSSYTASQKGLDLISKISEDTPLNLKGDVTRIRQILVNLLSNAVKFTESGSVQVSVDSKSIGKRRFEIYFRVIDTGIGIKKEDQENLFSVFSQADASITRKFGGTGLGLSICSSLAHVMGGVVKLESELDKGSTFTLVLPLEEGRVADEPETLINEKEIKFTEHKILVVEDNSINQKLAKLMLEKLGYGCDIAANGLEALKALKVVEEKGHSYTLIFMDMQMPEMDGISATKKIAEIYGDTRPKIVAMTANVYEEDRRKCFDAGMDDFIPKPLKVGDLKRVLGKELK
ncbi:MAG: hypothetical protein CME64_06275 [Halobacteriovoraceae bacterium]|nr:hypothetical protein [Halobacteriovoraceae bacterium]